MSGPPRLSHTHLCHAHMLHPCDDATPLLLVLQCRTLLSSEFSFFTASLMLDTVSDTGAYTEDAALTLSTLPKASPCLNLAPASGKST